MQTAWSILALALFVTDGAPRDQPEPPGPRFKVTLGISDSCEAAEAKTTQETTEPDSCSKPDEKAFASSESWQLSLPEVAEDHRTQVDTTRRGGEQLRGDL